MFLVADPCGDITNAHGFGLYEHDTRFLSRFVLTVNGCRSVVRSSARPGPAVVSTRAMVNGRKPDGHALHIHRSAVVDDGLHVNVMLHNPASHDRRVHVTLTTAADFRDMFAVRGFYAGKQRGTSLPPEIGERQIRFRYDALDGLPLWTDVRTNCTPVRTLIVPASRRNEAPSVRWTFTLTVPAGGREELSFLVMPGRPECAVPVDRGIRASLRGARSLAHQWADEVTRIETDNADFNRVLRRSMHDLRALLTPCAAGEVPAAGIPWFVAPFGRDACITAIESLMLTPRFAVGALRALAAHQGTAINPTRDEEPGKILHEIRVGELSRLGIVPFSTYYGSVDSTPLFVMLFAQTMRWLDADALYEDLLPNVRRALEWCDRWGDQDGDGYVEFGRYAMNGVENQGWKDSHDSLHHPDGADVLKPVALAEVQGYVYAAKAWLADVVERRGDHLWAAQLRVEAADLAARFERDFWMPEEGCYAYALDALKRPVRTIVSNVGHLLYCDLVRGEKANILAARLLRSDMLSGWGIRTLSSEAARYDPDSYHNGSIWPHDNAVIALGMRRTGNGAAAATVASQVLAGGMAQPLCRIPELYAGYGRDQCAAVPVPYPVSCSPQAWSAASAFAFLQAMLGLEVDGHSGTIICTPHLPAWLSYVCVRGMRFGRMQADIEVSRDAQGAYRVTINGIEQGSPMLGEIAAG